MDIFPLQLTSQDAPRTRLSDLKRVAYVEWLVKHGFWGRDLLTLTTPKQLEHLSKHPAWPLHILAMNKLFLAKRLVRVPPPLKPFFNGSCSLIEQDLLSKIDAMELGELELPGTIKADDSP